MEAILACRSPGVYNRLVGSGSLAGVLDQWLRHGRADRQTTLLRAVLRVLRVLPWTEAQMSGALMKSVESLQIYKCAPPLKSMTFINRNI